MLTSDDLTALAERWGNPRTEETLIFLTQAKDYQGLLVDLDLTPEHVEAVMAAIYAPSYVSVQPFEVLGPM